MAMDIYTKSRWFGRKFEVSNDSLCGLMVDGQKGYAGKKELIDSGGVNKFMAKNDEWRWQCLGLLQLIYIGFFCE